MTAAFCRDTHARMAITRNRIRKAMLQQNGDSTDASGGSGGSSGAAAAASPPAALTSLAAVPPQRTILFVDAPEECWRYQSYLNTIRSSGFGGRIVFVVHREEDKAMCAADFADYFGRGEESSSPLSSSSTSSSLSSASSNHPELFEFEIFLHKVAQPRAFELTARIYQGIVAYYTQQQKRGGGGYVDAKAATLSAAETTALLERYPLAALVRPSFGLWCSNPFVPPNPTLFDSMKLFLGRNFEGTKSPVDSLVIGQAAGLLDLAKGVEAALYGHTRSRNSVYFVGGKEEVGTDKRQQGSPPFGVEIQLAQSVIGSSPLTEFLFSRRTGRLTELFPATAAIHRHERLECGLACPIVPTSRDDPTPKAMGVLPNTKDCFRDIDSGTAVGRDSSSVSASSLSSPPAHQRATPKEAGLDVSVNRFPFAFRFPDTLEAPLPSDAVAAPSAASAFSLAGSTGVAPEGTPIFITPFCYHQHRNAIAEVALPRFTGATAPSAFESAFLDIAAANTSNAVRVLMAANTNENKDKKEEATSSAVESSAKSAASLALASGAYPPMPLSGPDAHNSLFVRPTVEEAAAAAKARRWGGYASLASQAASLHASEAAAYAKENPPSQRSASFSTSSSGSNANASAGAGNGAVVAGADADEDEECPNGRMALISMMGGYTFDKVQDFIGSFLSHGDARCTRLVVMLKWPTDGTLAVGRRRFNGIAKVAQMYPDRVEVAYYTGNAEAYAAAMDAEKNPHLSFSKASETVMPRFSPPSPSSGEKATSSAHQRVPLPKVMLYHLVDLSPAEVSGRRPAELRYDAVRRWLEDHYVYYRYVHIADSRDYTFHGCPLRQLAALLAANWPVASAGDKSRISSSSSSETSLKKLRRGGVFRCRWGGLHAWKLQRAGGARDRTPQLVGAPLRQQLPRPPQARRLHEW